MKRPVRPRDNAPSLPRPLAGPEAAQRTLPPKYAATAGPSRGPCAGPGKTRTALGGNCHTAGGPGSVKPVSPETKERCAYNCVYLPLVYLAYIYIYIYIYIYMQLWPVCLCTYHIFVCLRIFENALHTFCIFCFVLIDTKPQPSPPLRLSPPFADVGLLRWRGGVVYPRGPGPTWTTRSCPKTCRRPGGGGRHIIVIIIITICCHDHHDHDHEMTVRS